MGAKVAHRLERWVVMQAPTSQRFCVVRIQRPGFSKNANRWAYRSSFHRPNTCPGTHPRAPGIRARQLVSRFGVLVAQFTTGEECQMRSWARAARSIRRAMRRS